MAMPPPIVPAPMTATRRISRCGVSFASPGTLATSRSAKNTCRWAADCGEFSSSTNSSRSRAMPAAKSISVAAFTALMQ